MMLSYALLLVMTLLGSIASLFLKRASGSGDIVDMMKNPNLYIGGFLYFGSALLNILVLRRLDYSVVLPLTAITYIWTMLLSKFILNEKITFKKAMGVTLIIIGAIMVSH